MMVLQGNLSVVHLVRTAWMLRVLTKALSSVLLIGCYHGEVLRPL